VLRAQHQGEGVLGHQPGEAKNSRLIGKDPEAFVRDAALTASEDPFLKALQHAGETVTRLAVVFAAEEAGIPGPLASDGPWPDPAPMSSHLARLVTALEAVGAMPVLHAGEVGSSGAGGSGGQAMVVEGDDPEVFTTAVLAVLRAGPAGGMRCREVVEAMGLEAVPRRVERVRHHGKRLVARGVLAQAGRGIFTLPPQRRSTRG
jgi:hypothetical protein